MGLIRLHNVNKQFGGRIVLNELSVELPTGEVAGLIGPNGAGKTTLFKIIAGQVAPDSGTVTRSRGLEVGYLPQEPQITAGATLHDEVASAFTEILALERKMHELGERMAGHAPGAELDALLVQYDRAADRFAAAGGYAFEQRLKEILGGLGFAERDYALPMTALSGGQKCRAALAKLLLQDAHYLLLDEPTNHLDIDAVRWLEKFLAGHHGGALIVSHDRYFLDRLATRVIELERGQLVSYPGNYSNYVKVRGVRRLTQERQHEKDRAFIEKERDFIARHLAGQRSQEAKGRRTRLERRIAAGEFVLDAPGERRAVRIDFGDAEVRTGEVLVGEELSKRYGDKELFRDVTLRVNAGQRVAITGPNGVGKSTLLKILLDRLPPDAGTIWVDSKQIVGYFAQDIAEFDPQKSIFGELREARPDLSETTLRSILGGFLFSGDDVFKPLGALSGGEQSRVRLLKLILSNPNLLVLDEPTNHLDIASREVLEEALADFPGTILAVSHDRYFLDRIATKLLVMRPGAVRLYNGNYSQYIEQVEAERARAEVRAAEGARDAARAPAGGSDGARGSPAAGAAERKKRGGPKSPFARHSIEELEQEIMKREERVSDLTKQFGDPALARDHAALARLQTEFDALKAELAEIEAEWHARIE